MGVFSRLIKGRSGGELRELPAGDSHAGERLVELHRLRAVLEAAFSPDTAAPGTPSSAGPPSRGHCAVVSAIVWDRFGGELLSAMVQGESHWFNRLNVGGCVVDIDLTGDQFGLQAIRCGDPGSLWPGTRTRNPRELREETVRRAIRLADRAGLKDTLGRLPSLLDRSAGEVV